MKNSKNEKKTVKIVDKNTMSLTACLNRIMQKIKATSFIESISEELKDDFDYVGAKLKTSREETAILSCILEYSSGYTSCGNEDIADFLGCSNIEFMNYRKYLDSLARKRILRCSKTRLESNSYTLIKEVYEAIIEDKEYTEKNFSGLSPEELFSHIRILFKDFKEEIIDDKTLFDDLNMLVEVNMQNVFCQKVVDYGVKKLNNTEQRIFYFLCHRYVNYGEINVESVYLKNFVALYEDQHRFFRQFQAGKMRCQREGLICFGGDDNLMDKSVARLSEEVIKEFFIGMDVFCEERLEGQKDLMKCDDIVVKELFYNASEESQVSRLENLLEEKSFSDIQKRLEEMGMRRGFNIILYGGPGTGKTETTMQLARKTGRDVFFIDMSRLKSKWVGDSEKSVKAVFTTYRLLCKMRQLKPILFFNEADAIFGKRMENIDTSVQQMLNSIQNIILQEMEHIDGIMICTTNLHSNLDPAFERRFLYKVKLEKPDENVRSKIWKSMLKHLNEEQCNILAHKYDFSGGQIENVSRKSIVDYVLTGNTATLDTICKFCDEESFKSNFSRIGF